MQDYRNLRVWQEAHRFVLRVYDVTGAFPRHEAWGLTSQLRRAAVSIPSNIAEGCGRDSDPELARFLRIAAGSASEIDYQLLLARDLGYIPPNLYEELADSLTRIRRMTTRFIQKVEARTRTATSAERHVNGEYPISNSQQPTAQSQEP